MPGVCFGLGLGRDHDARRVESLGLGLQPCLQLGLSIVLGLAFALASTAASATEVVKRCGIASAAAWTQEALGSAAASALALASALASARANKQATSGNEGGAAKACGLGGGMS